MGTFFGSQGPGVFGGAQEYLGAMGGPKCFQGPRALGTLVSLGPIGVLETLVGELAQWYLGFMGSLGGSGGPDS